MSLEGWPGSGTVVLPADQARPFTAHEIAAPKLARLMAQGNVDGWLAKYRDELRAVVAAPDRPLTRDDLVYAATARCRCGAGYSYPKLDKDPGGQWICSAVFLGAQAGSEHDAAKPFAFWNIKSDDQPSANGQTTRPSGIVPARPEPKPDYQQRVIAERDALDGKLTKLDAFRLTPTFVGLSLDDQGLLVQQSDYMRGYLNVLDQRIQRFTSGS